MELGYKLKAVSLLISSAPMEKVKILIGKGLYSHGETKISLLNKIHTSALPLQVILV